MLESARLGFTGAIAGDNPVAEHLVRGLDRIGIEHKIALSGVLGNELEPKMKILEAPGAQVADRLGFFERFIDEQVGGSGSKGNLHSMIFVKSASELLDNLLGYDPFFLLWIGEHFLQFSTWIID